MAGITNAMATSFKQEVLEGLHNFNNSGGNTFKFALIKATPTGTYDATSTNYSQITTNSDEVTSTNYTAGGAALTNSGVTISGTSAYTTFSNPSWANVTFSTLGGMVYNTTSSSKCCGTFAFGGGAQTVNAGTFTVLMPGAGGLLTLN